MQKVKEILEKCSAGIVGFYRYVVSLLFFAIILFLYFIAAISTTILVKDDEGGHLFISDHPIITLIFISGLIAAFVSLKDSRLLKDFFDRIKKDETYFKKLRIKMLAVMGIIAVFWTLSTQFIPGADQLRIMNETFELHNEDYSRFQPGEYFERYQNQYGLLFITYFFSYLFGDSNYIVFSFFNIAALLIFYYELSELCADFEFGRPAQISVIILGFAFYPMIVYCSYIYGTMIGLAFGVAAMEKEMKFFKTQKNKYAAESAVLIMFSVIIKSNYLIFLIAAGICSVIELLRKKEKKLGLLPLLIAIAAILSSVMPKAVASNITKETLDGGASSWGWIAMGLQEGPRGSGAFNDYNIQLYRDVCDCDPELHAAMAKENIAERLKVFSEDKAYTLSFFTKKQAYQWNDPTFQYAWNIRDKQSQIIMSNWVQMFKSPRGLRLSLAFLNPLVTVIYLGALLFCVLCRSKTNIYTLILPMTFIGGYIFHTFWEAAPRYTLPYFVLLFPITIAGYSKLVQILSQRKKKSLSELKSTAKGRKTLQSTFLSIVPYLVISLLIICTVGIFLGTDSSLTADNEAYAEWQQTYSDKQVLKEGQYFMYANDKVGITLVEKDEENTEVTLSDNLTPVRVVYYQGNYWLKFTDEHMYLTVINDSQTVGTVKYNGNTPSRWSVIQAEDGGVSIIYNRTYALTYNSKKDNIYVSKYNGKQNQIWYFVKE